MNGHRRYAVSVMCEDRVGLVARLARSVTDLGGNIDEMRQTVVQGHFVFSMLAALPEDLDPDTVRERIESSADGAGMVTSILPCRDGDVPPAATGSVFLLTLAGEDAPGIFAKVSEYLADRRINIDDMSTRTDAGRYVLTAELTIPAGVDVKATRLELAEVMADRADLVSLLHRDIFEAVNRVAAPLRRISRKVES